MNLRSKLLAGFSMVVAIVLAMGIYMSISITSMSNQAKTVDAVDSGLAETLIGQGSVLRFLLYRDQSYLTKAKESFDSARAEFNRALTTMTIVANREILKTQQGNLDVLLQRILVSQDVEKKRLEIEDRMTPITEKLTADLQKLRVNVGKALAADFSQELWGVYNSLVEIGENFREARIAARMYTITQTPENEKIAFEWFEKTSALTKFLQTSVTDPENDKLIKDVLLVFADYETCFSQLIANARDNKDNNLTIRQAFETITNGCLTSSANATKALLSFGNDSQFSMYAGTSLVIIFCLVIALLLTRNVLRQLGKDPGVLAHIAQRVTDGDFNIDDGSARIGVYGNIVSMVKRLQETITHAQEESQRAQEQSKVAQEAMQNAEVATKEAQNKTQSMLIAADKLESVASIVSSASSELSAQIEQSERGASEQASRVTETATAMEEMNSTVLEVARNASAASDVSASTRQKAEIGAQVVRQAVASIQEVQQQSVKLKADMSLLDENAKAVSQIMGVISDIADQTNLLALNAAIEAARAGEAGRGFAVVADEVRKLAEKTMASTTDVGNAIRAIQNSAAQSMSQVDSAVKNIEQATEYANQSGVALNEIVAMVDNTADQVRAIATASEQQSASSEEINQSIMQVNTIAGETARAMEEAARAVSDLATQAHVLSQLIDEMKRG